MHLFFSRLFSSVRPFSLLSASAWVKLCSTSSSLYSSVISWISSSSHLAVWASSSALYNTSPWAVCWGARLSQVHCCSCTSLLSVAMQSSWMPNKEHTFWQCQRLDKYTTWHGAGQHFRPADTKYIALQRVIQAPPSQGQISVVGCTHEVCRAAYPAKVGTTKRAVSSACTTHLVLQAYVDFKSFWAWDSSCWVWCRFVRAASPCCRADL